MERIVPFLAVVFLAAGLVLSNSDTLAQDQGSAFDFRQTCMTRCNEAYGGEEWRRPNQSTYVGWAECMLKCERDYWDRFNKETDQGK